MFWLNTRFWQCLILIQQASALPRICTRVCAGLVIIVLLRTALGSLKEEERKKERRRTFCVGDDFGLPL